MAIFFACAHDGEKFFSNSSFVDEDSAAGGDPVSENSASESAGENEHSSGSDQDESAEQNDVSQLVGYYVIDGEITDNGEIITLKGVNWFGFETSAHVVHGLWARNHSDLVTQIRALGFNAVRLPICPDTLDGVTPSSISSSKNPDLQGLNSLQILDLIMAELDANEIYILLDHHRPDCSEISELWYTNTYSEAEWIEDLVFVADRYRHLTHFIGIDLKNEPHGEATWGTGIASTDWKAAAERAAEAILAINPDILIFVEGVQNSSHCSSGSGHWWGGNMEPIACAPIENFPGKIVYSPHVYGPDVYGQSYFSAADFPNNMPAIWQQHFGFLVDHGFVVAVGEFGGKFGEADARDDDWQIAFIDWMLTKNICHFFYWSLNPNSGDTGGILADDWTSIQTAKYLNLKRLIDACE